MGRIARPGSKSAIRGPAGSEHETEHGGVGWEGCEGSPSCALSSGRSRRPRSSASSWQRSPFSQNLIHFFPEIPQQRDRVHVLIGPDRPQPVAMIVLCWLDKRPRRRIGVASRPETASRVDLRRVPVPGRRSRLRAGVARVPRRHRHHQRVVVVDALAVPVRGRGLAVDGEPQGFVLDDDGVGR